MLLWVGLHELHGERDVDACRGLQYFQLEGFVVIPAHSSDLNGSCMGKGCTLVLSWGGLILCLPSPLHTERKD